MEREVSRFKDSYEEIKKNRPKTVLLDEPLIQNNGFYYTMEELYPKKWSDLSIPDKMNRIKKYCNWINDSNINQYYYKNINYTNGKITSMVIIQK